MGARAVSSSTSSTIPAADHPRGASTITSIDCQRCRRRLRQVPIEAGATYVFDKAYCNYAWWTRVHEARSTASSRARKTNAHLQARAPARAPATKKGDGFTVFDDADVKLVNPGPCQARRSRCVACASSATTGTVITLITNDLAHPAVEIAALYKARWQIELLFRWIKQHLKLRTFLGRSAKCHSSPGDRRHDRLSACSASPPVGAASSMPAIRFGDLITGSPFHP